jgi:hypothetical protein
MMERFRIRYGKARKDPEKAVLPALVYTSIGGDGITVRAISIGWWDSHVTLSWAHCATATPTPSDPLLQHNGVK